MMPKPPIPIKAPLCSEAHLLQLLPPDGPMREAQALLPHLEYELMNAIGQLPLCDVEQFLSRLREGNCDDALNRRFRKFTIDQQLRVFECLTHQMQMHQRLTRGSTPPLSSSDAPLRAYSVHAIFDEVGEGPDAEYLELQVLPAVIAEFEAQATVPDAACDPTTDFENQYTLFYDVPSKKRFT